MKKLFLNLALFTILCIILQSNSCYPDHVTGCECEDEKSAGTSKLISSSNPSASFSTYQYTGENDADGACHADMKLTFRWMDDMRAQNNERPPISYEFQTVFGYFPTNEGMETYNRDDNGIFTYTIHINEAADKSNPGAISYGIQLNYTGEPSANDNVKCDMNIKYRLYAEKAYTDGCDID